jgi:hypothetical protein
MKKELRPEGRWADLIENLLAEPRAEKKSVRLATLKPERVCMVCDEILTGKQRSVCSKQCADQLAKFRRAGGA